MTAAWRQKASRLGALSLITVLVSVSLASLSSAAPSKRDVAQAKERLDALNGELSVLVERFNVARIRLAEAEQRLDETREQADLARARADDAIADLNESAGRAYRGMQSQWSALLEADSLADFSDRLEFMGHLAQAETDLATTASNAEQEAKWLADELEKTVEERRSVLNDIDRRQTQIRGLIDQAREVYEKYRDAFAAERAAAAAAAAAQENAGLGSTMGVTPGPVPVVSGSVDAVLAAARSVIGVPYVFGAADPAVGFDCSGLTMWAWAHAGVSLPHSSTLQYASLPYVDRTALQAGDLIFSSYGRLGSGVIDHVALYIGGGQTIAATNPSSPVAYRTIDWGAYVGAARPG